MPSGDDCSDVFAGLGLDETAGLTAVAGVIVDDNAGSTLILDGLRANTEEGYQVRLLFAKTGDEMADGAMLRWPALAAGSLAGFLQSGPGIGTYKDESRCVCIVKV